MDASEHKNSNLLGITLIQKRNAAIRDVGTPILSTINPTLDWRLFAFICGSLLLSLNPTSAQAQEKGKKPQTSLKNNSPTTLKQWYALAKSGKPGSLAKASRQIIKIAERLLLQGKRDQAWRHANNLWLSSSPHDVRKKAWKILLLAEQTYRMLKKGHKLHLKAPGSRDHKRFLRWLQAVYVKKSPWIVDVHVTYDPILVSKGRAGEVARVTFVLSDAKYEQVLFGLLARSRGTFPTDNWMVLRATALKP